VDFLHGKQEKYTGHMNSYVELFSCKHFSNPTIQLYEVQITPIVESTNHTNNPESLKVQITPTTIFQITPSEDKYH